MQTLPFLTAKTSVLPTALEPEASKQKDVKGLPFTQVLSKQLTQAEVKHVSEARMTASLSKAQLSKETDIKGVTPQVDVEQGVHLNPSQNQPTFRAKAGVNISLGLGPLVKGTDGGDKLKVNQAQALPVKGAEGDAKSPLKQSQLAQHSKNDGAVKLTQAELVKRNHGDIGEAIIDAQLLATQITANTIQDVTDGKVVLDVPQAKVESHHSDAQLPIQPSLGQVAAEQATVTLMAGTPASPAKGKQAVVSTVDLSGRQSLVDDGLDIAQAEVNDKQLQQKANAFSQSHHLSNQTSQQSSHDKFAQSLAAENKVQSSLDIATAKPSSGVVSGVAETSSISTISLQPTAKFGMPSVQQSSVDNNINVYPGKTGWNEAISQKVVWMVGATEQSAKLTLNPPELGPLEVTININNDKADATFVSENPEVRKALEDGVSHLRHLMGQAGVELGQANVSTSKQQQEFQQANREQLKQQNMSSNTEQTDTPVSGRPTVSKQSDGLVDTFA